MIELKPSEVMTAEAWAKLHAANESTATIWDRRIVEHFVTALPRDARVLVLACGAGESARAIAPFRTDIEWHGVDYSQAGLDAAENNSGPAPTIEYGPRLGKYPEGGFVLWRTLTLMDLNAELPWPWADRAFDAVIACDVLQYVNKPDRLAGECMRLASSIVAATFPRTPETAGREGLWLFEPLDPFRLLKGAIKVHHLKQGDLLFALARIEPKP